MCLIGGQQNNRPLIRPDEFKHIALTDNVTFTGLATQDFFNFAVPDNQCLIINYVSLAVSFLNGSDDAVSWNMGYSAWAAWVAAKGSATLTPITNTAWTLGYFNGPIFFVFEPGLTIALRIYGAGATSADINLQARANAFLLSANYLGAFKKYQTIGRQL